MPRPYTHPAEGRTGRPAAGDFCDPETGELTSDGYALVRRAAGLGLPRKSVARLLGMHTDTFGDRRRKFPEIDEVYELGKAEADLQVSNALFKRAVGGDMAAIRWYEMTRTDRNPNVPVIEQDLKAAEVIEVPATLPEEEWTKRFSPTALPTDKTPVTIDAQ